MPLAVLYARFSPRPNPDECDSVDKQLERCRAYCEGHGYTVVAQYHDKDLSGERADNRPGLQKAVTAACERKAVLCVYSLSRLGLNQKVLRHGPARHRMTARYSTTAPHSPKTIMKQPTRR
jgi:DNA invertase Pin-like site-specific DNA recombinase